MAFEKVGSSAIGITHARTLDIGASVKDEPTSLIRRPFSVKAA